MVKMQFYLCGVERSCLTNRLQRHFVPLVIKNNYEFRKSYPAVFDRPNPIQVQLRGIHNRPNRLRSPLPFNPHNFESEFPRGIQIFGEGFRGTRSNGNSDIFPHKADQFEQKNLSRLPENFSQM